MMKEETAYQYFLSMIKLASRRRIKEVVMQYIVEEIIDESDSNLILYEANNFE